jgi:hypothetical protein
VELRQYRHVLALADHASFQWMNPGNPFVWRTIR